LIFAHPMPLLEVVKAHYEHEYTAGGCRINAEAFGLRKRMFVARLRRLSRYRTSVGSLLDVGCSTGMFLEVARDGGWNVSGVELSVEAARQAQQKFPGRVFCGTLADAPFPAGSLDVITMFDVIEHCATPLVELTCATTLLAADGLLVLTTPNIASLPARVMGRAYSYINPPDHLVYFSPRTMAVALAKAGLRHLVCERAYKTFSLDYILALLPRVNPMAARICRPLATMLPAGLRTQSVSLYAGEMWVVARKPSRSQPAW